MIVDFNDPVSVQALQSLISSHQHEPTGSELDDNRVFTVGLTSGVFDLFHHLHLNYLERCAGACDFLIVGIDSDDLVRRVKGPDRPIYNEIQRLSIVNGLKTVQAAFIIRDLEKDFGKMAEMFTPIIFKNVQYEKTVGAEWASGIQIIADTNNISSTSMAVETIVAKHLDKIEKPTLRV